MSNLSFLSKLLERVIQTRLQAFLDTNGLMLEMQSAYRRHHSTETAVKKVYSDLLSAADNGQLSALCLLDLTAAFDTVDLSCCCPGSSVSSSTRLDTPVVQVISSVTDHSASCVGLVHLPSSSLCVQCPRAQSLARYCLFCKWVIS